MQNNGETVNNETLNFAPKIESLLQETKTTQPSEPSEQPQFFKNQIPEDLNSHYTKQSHWQKNGTQYSLGVTFLGIVTGLHIANVQDFSSQETARQTEIANTNSSIENINSQITNTQLLHTQQSQLNHYKYSLGLVTKKNLNHLEDSLLNTTNTALDSLQTEKKVLLDKKHYLSNLPWERENDITNQLATQKCFLLEGNLSNEQQLIK